MKNQKHDLIRRIIAGILLSVSLSCLASGDERGTIEPGWYVYADGNVFFYLKPNKKENPSCDGIPDRWGFDTTTPVGKVQFSAFLLAYTSGREIRVRGDGGCIHGNTDMANELYVF